MADTRPRAAIVSVLVASTLAPPTALRGDDALRVFAPEGRLRRE